MTENTVKFIADIFSIPLIPAFLIISGISSIAMRLDIAPAASAILPVNLLLHRKTFRLLNSLILPEASTGLEFGRVSERLLMQAMPPGLGI